jgi:hypothetical protein
MPTPEDFNPENSRICWPAILAVFAVRMIVLITLSIAVAKVGALPHQKSI